MKCNQRSGGYPLHRVVQVSAVLVRRARYGVCCPRHARLCLPASAVPRCCTTSNLWSHRRNHCAGPASWQRLNCSLLGDWRAQKFNTASLSKLSPICARSWAPVGTVIAVRCLRDKPDGITLLVNGPPLSSVPNAAINSASILSDSASVKCCTSTSTRTFAPLSTMA